MGREISLDPWIRNTAVGNYKTKMWKGEENRRDLCHNLCPWSQETPNVRRIMKTDPIKDLIMKLLGLVVHAFGPSTWEQRQVDLREF